MPVSFELILQGSHDPESMGPMVLAMKTKPFLRPAKPGTRNRKLNSTGNSHFFIFSLLQMFE
jgi:hypothetical protein